MGGVRVVSDRVFQDLEAAVQAMRVSGELFEDTPHVNAVLAQYEKAVKERMGVEVSSEPGVVEHESWIRRLWDRIEVWWVCRRVGR